MSRCVPSIGIAATLQDALDRWDAVNEDLRALYDRLNDDKIAAAMPFDPALVTSPLPRAWQWLDGSAYSTHGRLMQRAYGLPPIETRLPLMYQGMSHRFLGPMEDVFLPSEADGIDFEAELGIITGTVPMGATATNALSRIRLAVQINDWSLRTLAAAEMKTGCGWVQAKPACSMAPVAVTLDELGDSWRDGRIDAMLNVSWNGTPFGAVPTYQMEFGFHDLIAHAARTRNLCAGTIIG
jgi:fumarylacetoacetate (FAA) hydrolase